MYDDTITQKILESAFDVHSRLGPGLLESTYRACLTHRLSREGLEVKAEVPVPVSFDGLSIPAAYRADLIVEQRVLLELKSIERILSIHISQTLTYLKHADLDVALLLNFNVRSLRDGIRRFDNRGSGRHPPSFSDLPLR
jgi:GxxExxY protein